jgi:2-C-methyl-D-erythritol 2,4-cyclodiphosphate synthase
MRVGFGYDVHAYGIGSHVMLGGVRVPHDRGVVAHSDGDVMLHALCDALLGATALGDIGQHFPDTDPRYRGISSQALLAEVAARVRAQGGRIVNVDVTVVAEAPRLAGYLEPMRKRLGETLDLAVERISVKAKHAERLGALGRQEGVAAMAVALVEVARA